VHIAQNNARFGECN